MVVDTDLFLLLVTLSQSIDFTQFSVLIRVDPSNHHPELRLVHLRLDVGHQRFNSIMFDLQLVTYLRDLFELLLMLIDIFKE